MLTVQNVRAVDQDSTDDESSDVSLLTSIKLDKTCVVILEKIDENQLIEMPSKSNAKKTESRKKGRSKKRKRIQRFPDSESETEMDGFTESLAESTVTSEPEPMPTIETDVSDAVAHDDNDNVQVEPDPVSDFERPSVIHASHVNVQDLSPIRVPSSDDEAQDDDDDNNNNDNEDDDGKNDGETITVLPSSSDDNDVNDRIFDEVIIVSSESELESNAESDVESEADV